MTILGIDPQKQNIEISPTNRLTNMYIIGATGSGKTTMVENMLVDDINRGFGCAFLDPHGDAINNIICRIKKDRLDDVILFDPILIADRGYYFGLNLFECNNTKSPSVVEYTVEQVLQVFSKIFHMSAETPRLNQYVRNISYSFVGTPYTMVDILPLLLDKKFRDKVTSSLTSNSTKLFWKSFNELRPSERDERIESTLDRVDGLVSNSIIYRTFGKSKTTLNFRNIMDSNKVLLCSLGAVQESFCSLMGAIIIGQFLMAALSRAKDSRRDPFFLYLDEFQRFSTPSMATLFSEARKYAVGTTISHQFRAQLDEKNAGSTMQAGSLIVFRVTAEDAKEIAPSFNLEPRPGDPIERPVRTPAQNVIEALLNRGSHEDPKVNDFVQKYLRPLHQAASDRIDKNSSDFEVIYEILPRKVYPEGSYGYDPRLIQQELNELNTLLFDSMTGKKYKGNDEKPDIIRMITAFGMYLGFSHYHTHEDIPNLRPWDRTRLLFIIQQFLGMDVKTPPEHYLDLMAQLSSQQFYVTKDNMPLNLTYFYTTLRVTPDITDMRDVARKIMKAEKIRAEEFESAMLDIIDSVAKSPILLDSGKTETTEGPRQSYADRANEVANELTQLRKGHAKARLPHGEYDLETIVPNTNRDYLEERKERIIQNTIKNYCSSAEEIDEEIRKRQDGGDEPPPTTTRKHPI